MTQTSQSPEELTSILIPFEKAMGRSNDAAKRFRTPVNAKIDSGEGGPVPEEDTSTMATDEDTFADSDKKNMKHMQEMAKIRDEALDKGYRATGLKVNDDDIVDKDVVENQMRLFNTRQEEIFRRKKREYAQKKYANGGAAGDLAVGANKEGRLSDDEIAKLEEESYRETAKWYTGNRAGSGKKLARARKRVERNNSKSAKALSGLSAGLQGVLALTKGLTGLQAEGVRILREALRSGMYPTMSGIDDLETATTSVLGNVNAVADAVQSVTGDLSKLKGQGDQAKLKRVDDEINKIMLEEVANLGYSTADEMSPTDLAKFSEALERRFGEVLEKSKKYAGTPLGDAMLEKMNAAIMSNKKVADELRRKAYEWSKSLTQEEKRLRKELLTGRLMNRRLTNKNMSIQQEELMNLIDNAPDGSIQQYQLEDIARAIVFAGKVYDGQSSEGGNAEKKLQKMIVGPGEVHFGRDGFKWVDEDGNIAIRVKDDIIDALEDYARTNPAERNEVVGAIQTLMKLNTRFSAKYEKERIKADAEAQQLYESVMGRGHTTSESIDERNERMVDTILSDETTDLYRFFNDDVVPAITGENGEVITDKKAVMQRFIADFMNENLQEMISQVVMNGNTLDSQFQRFLQDGGFISTNPAYDSSRKKAMMAIANMRQEGWAEDAMEDMREKIRNGVPLAGLSDEEAAVLTMGVQFKFMAMTSLLNDVVNIADPQEFLRKYQAIEGPFKEVLMDISEDNSRFRLASLFGTENLSEIRKGLFMGMLDEMARINRVQEGTENGTTYSPNLIRSLIDPNIANVYISAYDYAVNAVNTALGRDTVPTSLEKLRSSDKNVEALRGSMDGALATNMEDMLDGILGNGANKSSYWSREYVRLVDEAAEKAKTNKTSMYDDKVFTDERAKIKEELDELKEKHSHKVPGSTIGDTELDLNGLFHDRDFISWMVAYTHGELLAIQSTLNAEDTNDPTSKDAQFKEEFEKQMQKYDLFSDSPEERDKIINDFVDILSNPLGMTNDVQMNVYNLIYNSKGMRHEDRIRNMLLLIQSASNAAQEKNG